MLTDGPAYEAGQRAQRIRRTARLLSTYLAEESDPEVWHHRELAALRAKLPEAGLDEVEQALGRLSPRRRRFDPSEVEAQPYREALDKRADLLLQEGQLAEGAEVLHERVQRCPTSAARLSYGAVLHKLGRVPEAMEQYSRVPFYDSYRHFNCAASSWREERPDEGGTCSCAS